MSFSAFPAITSLQTINSLNRRSGHGGGGPEDNEDLNFLLRFLMICFVGAFLAVGGTLYYHEVYNPWEVTHTETKEYKLVDIYKSGKYWKAKLIDQTDYSVHVVSTNGHKTIRQPLPIVLKLQEVTWQKKRDKSQKNICIKGLHNQLNHLQ